MARSLGITGARKPVPPEERTCIIHAGGHKTGTSAVQKFLGENQKRLRRRGYLVPAAGRIYGEHHRLIYCLAGVPISPRHASYGEQLAEELRRYDHDHIIISSERFETLFRSEDVFRRVVKSLSSHGYRIRVIYYARNAPQLLNSRYNQITKTFGLNCPFSEFVDRNIERRAQYGFGPHHLLNLLGDETIEWIVRPYNADVRALGTERDFLNCAGLGDFLGTKPAIRANEAVGPVAIEAARRSLQELVSSGMELTKLRRGLCGRALSAVLQETAIREPAYCGLTSEVARKIETALQPKNDEFAQRCWGTTWAEAFNGDVGLDFVSNDLIDVPPSGAQREALQTIAERLRPRIVDIATNGPLHEV